jgi:4,5-dihydroxyphthalate decarboxylase
MPPSSKHKPLSQARELSLNMALGAYGHTAALLDGTVTIQGVIANFADSKDMIAAFRRMVREVAYDVCEMAPTTYFAARSIGAPYIALPVFVMRRFHHGGIVCRKDASIRMPTDLEGKRVGVRAYSVTTGVWTRGIFADEYGLDLARVAWVVADEDHVASVPLPGNVIRAPRGQSLAAMMASGELHAGFAGPAGLGEAVPRDLQSEAYPDLFPNAAQHESDWFRRTSIYPIHGLVVVKEALLAAHPWLARALFTALLKAKDHYLRRLKNGDANTAEDQRYRDLAEIVGDPLPYGLQQNRPAIETLIAYTYRQGLIPEVPTIEALFVDPTI